ncbi:MAG: spore coat associated protein CotJA [Clostridiales bacterium]|nr:spore coat associated protein CotJA [Clostridiales bacterium]
MDMNQNNPSNRAGGRPYNNTCGMNTQSVGGQNGGMRGYGARKTGMRGPLPPGAPRAFQEESAGDCGCRTPEDTGKVPEMYAYLSYLTPAMAYVPCQKFTETFDLCKALQVGTVFPQLCKPFCGKRGGC